MKHLLFALMAACALSCAQAQLGKEYDIRPATTAGAAPSAVKWQDANDAVLAASTTPEALAPYLAHPKAAAALLARVKKAYETDPLAATQIAAISQLVMREDRPQAPAERELWTGALLKAARESQETYRTLLLLDQLRWCGKAEQAAAVRRLGETAKDNAVKAFAAMVARELDAAGKR